MTIGKNFAPNELPSLGHALLRCGIPPVSARIIEVVLRTDARRSRIHAVENGRIFTLIRGNMLVTEIIRAESVRDDRSTIPLMWRLFQESDEVRQELSRILKSARRAVQRPQEAKAINRCPKDQLRNEMRAFNGRVPMLENYNNRTQSLWKGIACSHGLVLTFMPQVLQTHTRLSFSMTGSLNLSWINSIAISAERRTIFARDSPLINRRSFISFDRFWRRFNVLSSRRRLL